MVNSDSLEEVKTLDARGLRCPLPVIRTEACLRKMKTGQKLLVLSDDPVAMIDIPHYCRMGGHGVERMPDRDGTCVFQVTAGSKSSL